jgi:hypothetical protein
MDAFSVVMSLAVQCGVSVDVIVSKLKDQRFEPEGMTDDADIPHVTSVMDWLARESRWISCPPSGAPNSASCPSMRKHAACPPNSRLRSQPDYRLSGACMRPSAPAPSHG